MERIPILMAVGAVFILLAGCAVFPRHKEQATPRRCALCHTASMAEDWQFVYQPAVVHYETDRGRPDSSEIRTSSPEPTEAPSGHLKLPNVSGNSFPSGWNGWKGGKGLEDGTIRKFRPPEKKSPFLLLPF